MPRILIMLILIPSLPFLMIAENPESRKAIEFVEFELENGLHVIMHRNTRSPIVTVNLWYHVGSKNEREGRTGFAHLFEHMMFQGSENVPNDGHFKYIQQAGGTLNGSTSYDRTNYFETLPSNQLELGLWLEADRMRSLAVTQENLDNQREVVKEERRTRVDNVPYGKMMETLFAEAFKTQSYRWPVIGSMADLNAASLEDVRSFHSMYYVPNNASLCIAGDIEYDEAEALVRRHFSDIPRGAVEIYRPDEIEPPQSEQRRISITDNVRLPAMSVAFHIPDQNHEDFYPLDLLSTILSSGRSSPLYQRLVYTDRLAQRANCFAYGLEQPGLFIFQVTAQMGKELKEIEAVLWEEIRKTQESLFDEKVLQKARNQEEDRFFDRIGRTSSVANQLNSYHIFQGNAGQINTELDRIFAVTREDIRRVARQYLTPENVTVLYCLPKERKKR